MAANASPANSGPEKKMAIKRTQFSLWTAAGLGGRSSQTSSPAPRTSEANPPRVVSDVLPSTESRSAERGSPALKAGVMKPAGQVPARPSMAGHARIMAANAQWEKERKRSEEGGRTLRASSVSSESTSSDTSMPAALPAPTSATGLPSLHPSSNSAMQRKRSTEVMGPETKRSRVSTASPALPGRGRRTSDAELHQARQQAKAATDKQLSSVQGDGTASSPQWTRPKTGRELLEHIMKDVVPSRESETQSPESEGSFAPPQSRVVPLVTTTDGRRYEIFKDVDGVGHYMKGALFPTGYSRTSDPTLPFICPVDICKSSFPKLKSLQGHMIASHSRTTYRDNCNGTMTMIGKYKNTDGPSPGIIVERAGRQPETKTVAKKTETPAPQKIETPVPLPQLGFQAPSSDIKNYLHSFLSPTQIIPDRLDVRYMLGLKKKRNLPDEWIQFHKGGKLENTVYAASLAYICGQEVTGVHRCTRAELEGLQTMRLSGICVRPPPFPPGTQATFSPFITCVGCKYYSALQRRTSRCDWALTGSSQSSSESPDEGMMNNPMQRAEQGHENADDSVREAATATARAVNHLEMEEWEFAPGKKMDKSTGETIAMSSAFLTSNQPLPAAQDVSVHDLVVGRGRSHQWPAMDDTLRICYIAAGKVVVKMGDQTFKQGPNSTLIIRPGKACTVENYFYVDAVVHCTTIEDYRVE